MICMNICSRSTVAYPASTCKGMNDPPPPPGGDLEEPGDRSRRQWASLYQSASSSGPAPATCPTPSVSELFSERGQKPAARFSSWLTEGFLHGSLRGRVVGCLRSHYLGGGGGGGSYHVGSCKSRMSSWTRGAETWQRRRGSIPVWSAVFKKTSFIRQLSCSEGQRQNQ